MFGDNIISVRKLWFLKKGYVILYLTFLVFNLFVFDNSIVLNALSSLGGVLAGRILFINFCYKSVGYGVKVAFEGDDLRIKCFGTFWVLDPADLSVAYIKSRGRKCSLSRFGSDIYLSCDDKKMHLYHSYSDYCVLMPVEEPAEVIPLGNIKGQIAKAVLFNKKSLNIDGLGDFILGEGYLLNDNYFCTWADDKLFIYKPESSTVADMKKRYERLEFDSCDALTKDKKYWKVDVKRHFKQHDFDIVTILVPVGDICKLE